MFSILTEFIVILTFVLRPLILTLFFDWIFIWILISILRKINIDSVVTANNPRLALHFEFWLFRKFKLDQIDISCLVLYSDVTADVNWWWFFYNCRRWSLYRFRLLNLRLRLYLSPSICPVLISCQWILLRLVFHKSFLDILLCCVFYQLWL